MYECHMITNTIYFSNLVSTEWNDLIHHLLRVGETMDLSTTDYRFIQSHGRCNEFDDFFLKLLERDGPRLKDLKLNDIDLLGMFTHHCSNLVKLDCLVLYCEGSKLVWKPECCNLTSISLAFQNHNLADDLLGPIFRLNQHLKSVSLFWVLNLNFTCLQQLNPLVIEKLHFYLVSMAEDTETNQIILKQVGLKLDSNRDSLMKTVFVDIFRLYPRL